MSKFQVILLTFFVICIVVGVGFFATYKGGDNETTLPQVTVWGTFPSSVIQEVVRELNLTRDKSIALNYVEFTPEQFNKEFIETLARSGGPDAVLLPQELIARHKDKIVTIPASVMTERDFKNTYITQAELYLDENREILALPFTVDPLVMYWNRDIFSNAGIALAPVYWDEFNILIPKITLKDARFNIQRSTIAMGEFTNISHARELLGALLLQSGNPVTLYGDATSGGMLVSTIGDGQYSGSKTSQPAVEFFTQFANPRHPSYSWNRSLPLSKSWFLSGSLATYFGFASELFDLRAKNPNIDFDVSPLPQPRGGRNRVTYGTMYGFSIVKSTQYPSVTYSVMQILTSTEALSILSKKSFLPPVRRDMIATGSVDPYQAIFYDSALISRGWLDTNSLKTSRIFQNMVEAITSGRSEVYQALRDAHDRLDISLRNP